MHTRLLTANGCRVSHYDYEECHTHSLMRPKCVLILLANVEWRSCENSSCMSSTGVLLRVCCLFLVSQPSYIHRQFVVPTCRICLPLLLRNGRRIVPSTLAFSTPLRYAFQRQLFGVSRVPRVSPPLPPDQSASLRFLRPNSHHLNGY